MATIYGTSNSEVLEPPVEFFITDPGPGYYDDAIYGYEGDDTLYGYEGNDYLDGGGTSDDLDFLVGGSGTDTFVIGDSTGVGYLESVDDGHDISYAVITDFSGVDDWIQVHANASYSLGYGDWYGNSNLDTEIYAGNDLIAIVQDTTNVDMNRDFWYV